LALTQLTAHGEVKVEEEELVMAHVLDVAEPQDEWVLVDEWLPSSDKEPGGPLAAPSRPVTRLQAALAASTSTPALCAAEENFLEKAKTEVQEEYGFGNALYDHFMSCRDLVGEDSNMDCEEPLHTLKMLRTNEEELFQESRQSKKSKPESLATGPVSSKGSTATGCTTPGCTATGPGRCVVGYRLTDTIKERGEHEADEGAEEKRPRGLLFAVQEVMYMHINV
jgi:hypothetical protein